MATAVSPGQMSNRMNTFLTDLRDRISRNHRANRERGIYGFMWWTGLKIIAVYFIIVIPLVLIAKQFIDFNQVFQYLTDNLRDESVILVFFISESFLGMIPPDIFLIWATKFDNPMPWLFMLGVLSYAGGIISYLIGKWLSKRPRIKTYSEKALEKYILLTKKWGGAFVIIAALFPFSPFSMVVIAVSLLKYPFKLYLFFGLSRIVRFVVQGAMYAGLFNLDKIIG